MLLLCDRFQNNLLLKALYLIGKLLRKPLYMTSSFIPVGNHQATDTKINKLTIIVLESADPYLLDRVEFKHTSLLNLSPLIFKILCQHSFFLLYRFECKIVQYIPIVDNAWAQKTLIVAGVPWRTSARFGVTVEMQHRIPCIGSHTNQDDAPQSLQCSPMNCSELLPGIIYPLFALITQYIF